MKLGTVRQKGIPQACTYGFSVKELNQTVRKIIKFIYLLPADNDS